MDDTSPWIARWAGLVRPGGSVLDIACGAGRHSRWFARGGHPVTAVDRDGTIADWASRETGVVGVVADLEGGPWPFTGRRFDAVVVTNYLHRPLFPSLIDALKPNGVLLYETFTIDNYFRHRHPRRWEFCLAPNELLRLTSPLRVLHYDEGEHDGGQGSGPSYTARLVAQKAGPETPS